MKPGLRIIITIIVVLCRLTLCSQSITFFGGVNNNIFHDYFHSDPHYNSSYKSKVGYYAGIGLDSIKIDWITFYFTLQLDKYGGDLEASAGGLGGGNLIEAAIDKWIISLGIYPINFRLFHKINLHIGLEISKLIYEEYKGTVSGWLMGQPGWSYDLVDRYDHYSLKTYFGFKFRITYNLLYSREFGLTNTLSTTLRAGFTSIFSIVCQINSSTDLPVSFSSFDCQSLYDGLWCDNCGSYNLKVKSK